MITLSFWKIIVVLFVALVVLGPERLAHTMRLLGRIIMQFRRLLSIDKKN